VGKRVLTEKKDYYGIAKKQMRLSERILAEIPGFRGYKEKELRRESDKLIRNHLYRKLSEAKTDVKDVFQKLSDRRSLDVLSDMDRLVAKFDRVTEKANHASYGYSGFFDVIKINEEALDRMIDFDNRMVDEAAKVVDEATAFKTEIMKQKYDKAKERVQSLTDTLNAFEEAFDERQEVILGVK
jgi:predicted translin family RNA/ssDNA-binding protein